MRPRPGRDQQVRHLLQKRAQIVAGPEHRLNPRRGNLFKLFGAARGADDAPALRDQPGGQCARAIAMPKGKKRFIHLAKVARAGRDHKRRAGI